MLAGLRRAHRLRGKAQQADGALVGVALRAVRAAAGGLARGPARPYGAAGRVASALVVPERRQARAPPRHHRAAAAAAALGRLAHHLRDTTTLTPRQTQLAQPSDVASPFWLGGPSRTNPQSLPARPGGADALVAVRARAGARADQHGSSQPPPRRRALRTHPEDSMRDATATLM